MKMFLSVCTSSVSISLYIQIQLRREVINFITIKKKDQKIAGKTYRCPGRAASIFLSFFFSNATASTLLDQIKLKRFCDYNFLYNPRLPLRFLLHNWRVDSVHFRFSFYFYFICCSCCCCIALPRRRLSIFSIRKSTTTKF